MANDEYIYIVTMGYQWCDVMFVAWSNVIRSLEVDLLKWHAAGVCCDCYHHLVTLQEYMI